MVEHKLMDSKADQASYNFVNSAQEVRRAVGREVPNAPDGKIVTKGILMSFDQHPDKDAGPLANDKKVTLLLETNHAFQMWVDMRDALRHVISTMSDEEKARLRVVAERDAWGLERMTDRKSHIAEDLGL